MNEPEEIWYELRRPQDSGLDSQAAGVRRDEEISVHPPDPRRTALRLWQHLHARVSMDGRQGVCRALHESARQLELRPGLRQHHSIQLPWRRLQRSDGWSRRGPEEGIRRRDSVGSDRRERRRTAHQLGRDTDQPLQSGRQPAGHFRLGKLQYRPTSRSSRRPGSARRRSRTRRIMRGARRLPMSRRSKRR